MSYNCGIGAAETLAALDALHHSHGVRPRYTCWTEGHQGGAYVHTALLGDRAIGDSGPWRRTGAEAFADALEIAQKLAARIDEAKAERERKP